jgi:hypothetical protein
LKQDAATIAFSSLSLLGWVEVEDLEDTFFSADESVLPAIMAVAEDHELRRLLREATGGRVSNEILSAAGLSAIRSLAVWVLDHTGEENPHTPNTALAYVLNTIHERVGSRPGEWLNSLALPGKRILGAAAGGDDVGDDRLYVAGAERAPQAAPRIAEYLASLKQADGARLLAPRLYREPKGLEALLRKYGPDAISVIKGCLTRAMIDGTEIGKVHRWSYFTGPLEDERHAAELAALGMKPGDCLGLHRAALQNSNSRRNLANA